MDKLTGIKLKYPDGSYSDEILISVLADHVKYDDVNNVKDILNKLDKRIDQIINPSASTITLDAELQDLRIGADNETYSSAGSAIRTNITKNANKIEKNKNDIIDLKETIDGDKNIYPIFQKGTLTSSGEESNSKFLRSIGYISLSNVERVKCIFDSSTYSVRFFYYSSDDISTYLGAASASSEDYFHPQSGANFIRFRINRTDNTSINIDEADTMRFMFHYENTESLKDVVNSVESIVQKNISTIWTLGNITSSGNDAAISGGVSPYIRSGFVKYKKNTQLFCNSVLKSGSQTEDRVNFAYCYDYKRDYLGRVSLYYKQYSDAIEGTEYIRFTYGYPSAANMNVADVNTFSADWDVQFINEIWKTLDYIKYNESVTPQMFGAIADGVHDDTEAFQAAIDTGRSVFIPTSNHQVYRITHTINIRNECKAIYGTGQWKANATPGGLINFDLNPLHDAGYTINNLRTYPLFELNHTGNFMIKGLKITCSKANTGQINPNTGNPITKRVGYFLSATDESRVDYDFRLENVQVGGFYRGIRFTGRGCEIYNSQFNSINYLATFMWVDEDSNTNHPPGTGQRAITFKNNRLHSVGNQFIRIKSGSAYGLTFTNNTIDNGKGVIVDCEADVAKNWIIQGNLFQGMETKTPMMLFRHGLSNCLIADNVFSADLGYWYNRQKSPPTWLKVDGIADGLNFNGNTVVNSSSSMLYFDIIRNSVINGNVFSGPCLNNLSNDSIDYDDEGEAIDTSDEEELSPVTVPYRNSVIYITTEANNVAISGNITKTNNENIVVIGGGSNVTLPTVIDPLVPISIIYCTTEDNVPNFARKNGTLLFNTSTLKLEIYYNNEWVVIGS